MDNEKIVRALRNTCNGCNPTPCCEFEALGPAAADLIESLQAQLAASQRREKAAGCDGCAEWGKWENEIEYGYPSPCTKCKRRCTDNWHRPQEAGEGENNA